MQTRNNNNTTSSSSKPKKAKKQEKTGRRKSNFSSQNVKVDARYPTKDGFGQLSLGLNHIQQAAIEYLAGLSDPEVPTKVPVVLGQFELMTNTYKQTIEGTAVASTAGTAYVQCVPDNWGENPTAIAAYTTGGNGIWFSTAGGTSVTTVPYGGNISASSGAAPLAKLDPGWEASTQGRMVSCILEVWPESSAQVSTGTLTIATVQTAEGLADNILGGVNYAQVTGLDQKFCSHQEYPIPGWKSGVVAHTFAVPFDETCFYMNKLPATGSTSCGSTIIACVGSGMQAGQILRWRVSYKYETTMPQIYQTNVLLEPTVDIPPAMIAEGVRHVKAIGPSAGPVSRGRLKGVAAALQTKEGGLGDALSSALQRVAKGAGVGEVLRHGAKSVIGSVVSKVPVIGDFLRMGTDWLFG